MDNDKTRTAASELDLISGELHLAYRAIDYLADKLTTVSEEDLDKELAKAQLIVCYRESSDIALILSEYTNKLRDLEQRLDNLAAVLYAAAKD